MKKKSYSRMRKARQGKKTKQVKKTMAKKRRRTYAKRKSSAQKSMFSGLMRPLSAVAYGAVRGKVNTFVRNSPIAKVIPASNVADEASMLLAFWGARKLGAAKNPFFGSLIRAGEAIEWASLGQELSAGGLAGLFNNNNNNNGGGF